jgi:hypothetical protein
MQNNRFLAKILIISITVIYATKTPPLFAAQGQTLAFNETLENHNLAQKKSKKSKRKRRKKIKPESLDIESSSVLETKTDSTSASALEKKTYRGLLGFVMGGNMALIFGAAGTMPYSKNLILDGGFDYFKTSSNNSSASVMRFGAGGSYIISASSDSLIRAGGRLGLAMISASVLVEGEFEGEEFTESKSTTSLFGEGRAAYEKKWGSLNVGAEVQLPIFFSSSVSGTNGLAIYGTVGKDF